MSTISVLSYFPVESLNHQIRCEERFENYEKICFRKMGLYIEIDEEYENEWQISLKNGKRLNRLWSRCGGMAFVQDQYSGESRTIYNEKFDAPLNGAKQIQRQERYLIH